MHIAGASIEQKIPEAIGDTTKMHTGPTDEQIVQARRSLYHTLDLSYSRRRPGLTQLEPDIYDQWVKMSGDYDIDVQDWLRGGTPMGIEECMVPRGVFPQIDESTPAELRRPLDHWHEGFTNYKSLEAEPGGSKALDELVAVGFVK